MEVGSTAVDAGIRPPVARRTEITGRDPRLARMRELTGLTWTLSRKNFRVRYKRATIGVGWAVLQPAFQAVVLSYVFQHVFKAGTGVPHYPVYVLAGLLPWIFFTQAVNGATLSVFDNASLVRKVAVPQLIYPLSTIGGTLIAFSAATAILLVGGLAVGGVGVEILLLPLALALELLIITGTCAITSALYPAYRDVRYVVESLLMVGLYVTPVLYRPSAGSRAVRVMVDVNPLTGVLDLYRAAYLSLPVSWSAVGESLLVGVVLLGLGLLVFRARCDEFADLV